jgi:hypothetical protein
MLTSFFPSPSPGGSLASPPHSHPDGGGGVWSIHHHNSPSPCGSLAYNTFLHHRNIDGGGDDYCSCGIQLSSYSSTTTAINVVELLDYFALRLALDEEAAAVV